jgi:hypothetical protein
MTIFGLRRHSTGLGLSPRRARRASAGPGGDTQAPSVPQNLVATAVSSSQINLTWNASTDNVAVTGYNIYRDNVLIDSSPTNSYADTGARPWHRVRLRGQRIRCREQRERAFGPGQRDHASGHRHCRPDRRVAL